MAYAFQTEEEEEHSLASAKSHMEDLLGRRISGHSVGIGGVSCSLLVRERRRGLRGKVIVLAMICLNGSKPAYQQWPFDTTVAVYAEGRLKGGCGKPPSSLLNRASVKYG